MPASNHANKAAIAFAAASAVGTPNLLENAAPTAAVVGTGNITLPNLLENASATLFGVVVAGTPSTSAATWDPSAVGANVTLSNGNLTATVGSTASSSTHGVIGYSGTSGKLLYFEVFASTVIGAGNTWGVGIASTSASLAQFTGGNATSIGIYQNGKVFNNTLSSVTYFTFASDVWIGVAVLLNGNSSKMWFTKDGLTWNNDVLANQNPATQTGGFTTFIGNNNPFIVSGTAQTVVPSFGTTSGNGNVAIINVGPSGFAYPVPGGGCQAWSVPGLENASPVKLASGAANVVGSGALTLNAIETLFENAAGGSAAALIFERPGIVVSGSASGNGLGALTLNAIEELFENAAGGSVAALIFEKPGLGVSGTSTGHGTTALSPNLMENLLGAAAGTGDAEIVLTSGLLSSGAAAVVASTTLSLSALEALFGDAAGVGSATLAFPHAIAISGAAVGAGDAEAAIYALEAAQAALGGSGAAALAVAGGLTATGSGNVLVAADAALVAALAARGAAAGAGAARLDLARFLAVVGSVVVVGFAVADATVLTPTPPGGVRVRLMTMVG